MAKHAKLLIICIVLHMHITSCLATDEQSQSHYGTDFYFGVPYDSHCANVSLDIASISIGTYDLTIPFLNMNETGKSLTNMTTSISLPCKIGRSGTFVENRGIRLKTSVNVAVYVTKHSQVSAESFLVLPAKHLGKRYYPATYTPSPNEVSYIMVVATEPCTHVVINSIAKGITNIEGNSTINQFEVTQFVSNNSLTGFEVASDKPVSVISGTTCAKIPAIDRNNDKCDLIMEQMVPVETLDNTYIVPTISQSEPYEFESVNLEKSANESIRVYFGAKNKSLSGGIAPTEKQSVSINTTIIVSSHPRAVFQFGATNPFMTVVPGLRQFLNQYYFVVPGAYQNAQNNLSIIVESNETNEFNLDGRNLTTKDFVTFNISPPWQNYTVLSKNVTSGFHNLYHRNESVKFGLLVYGFGTAVNDTFGYGYPAGLKLPKIGINETTNASVTSKDCTMSITISGNSSIKQPEISDTLSTNQTNVTESSTSPSLSDSSTASNLADSNSSTSDIMTSPSIPGNFTESYNLTVTSEASQNSSSSKDRNSQNRNSTSSGGSLGIILGSVLGSLGLITSTMVVVFVVKLKIKRKREVEPDIKKPDEQPTIETEQLNEQQ